MDYLRKTKDRLMQSVGLQSSIPDDPELAASQQRLKLLYQTVQSQRSSMIQYARSMCLVGEAARKLSDDVSRFYTKSAQHQQSVGAFIDASMDQESNALFLFKEQFADVESHFDHWMFEIQDLNEQSKRLMEQHHHIGELKTKIEAGQKNPSTYQSDQGVAAHEGLKIDMQMSVTTEKQFLKDKTALVSTVNQTLLQRYERFDVVFIRLMEFQKDFFADGLEVMEHYAPIVSQYRQHNKIGDSGPSVGSKSAAATAKLVVQEAPKQNAPQPTPKPQPHPQSASSPSTAQAPASSPQQQKPVEQKPTPTSQQQPPPQQKQMDLFDLDFGASPSTSKPTSQQSNSNNNDVFSMLGSSNPSPSSSTPKPSTIQQKPQQSQTQDLFGDIFSSQPQPQQKTQSQKQQQKGSLEDFFAGPSSSTTSTPKASSSFQSTGGDEFDSFLATNRKAGSQGVDDIDVDSSKPTPKKADDSLSGFNFGGPSKSSSSDFGHSDFDFDPLNSNSSVNRAGTASTHKPSYVPQPEEPQGPQLTAHEEKCQIEDYKSKLEQRIEQWRYAHGVERSIQQLLASLHTVLWTGHTWKKVDTTGLLDHASIKKVFRRALLTVHPDKVSTGTPEMKATADLVFEILNNAFKKYEQQQGLRA